MKRLFVLLLVFISIQSSGQKKIRTYFDEQDLETEEKNAFYYKEGMQVTNKAGRLGYTDTVKSYYCKSGSFRSVSNYIEGVETGLRKEYYENGNLKEISIYKEYRKVGESKLYYPDGKLQCLLEYPGEMGSVNKFFDLDFKIIEYGDSLGRKIVENANGTCICYFVSRNNKRIIKEEGKVNNGLRDLIWKGFKNDTLLYVESFKNGELLRGKSFSVGKEFPYTVYSIMAEFPGGLPELYKFLNKNVKYPPYTRKNGINGKVFVQFEIEKDGSLSNVKIIKGLHESVDEESLRLINLMPKWSPAIQRGLPVKSKFVLPLTFKLVI